MQNSKAKRGTKMGEQIRTPEVTNSVQQAPGCNDNLGSYRSASSDENGKKSSGLSTTDIEILGGELLLAGGGLIAFQKIDKIGGDINGISSTLTKDLTGAEKLLQGDFGQAATGLQGALTNTTTLLQADFTKATTLLQGDFTKATNLATQGVGVIHSDLANIGGQLAKPPAETTITNTTINNTTDKTIDKTTNNSTVNNHKDIIIEHKPGEKPTEPAPHQPPSGHPAHKICATGEHTKAPDGYQKLSTPHPKGPIASPGLSHDISKVAMTSSAAAHPHDFRTALFAAPAATAHESVSGLKGVTGGAHAEHATKTTAHLGVHAAPHMAPHMTAKVSVSRMPHMGKLR
jgi:hypothetical protein